MSNLEQAARQALEALETLDSGDSYKTHNAAAALREALADQAEQEPDYFGLTHEHTWLSISKKQYDKLKPEGRMACYAAPQHAKEVELTDREIEILMYDFDKADDLGFARAVIAAFKEKNK